MRFNDLFFYNPSLSAALLAWAIAQILKVLIEFIKYKKWNWALLFRAGGMPSSHSAMVSASALSVGLQVGFDTAVFTVAVIFAMIVIYDATGVRRESGRQAVLINSMIEELTKGKIPPGEKLKEVLGHTPGEAILGTLLGLVLGLLVWLYSI
jgi:acid phosphatase family membrane protein YuiD